DPPSAFRNWPVAPTTCSNTSAAQGIRRACTGSPKAVTPTVRPAARTCPTSPTPSASADRLEHPRPISIPPRDKENTVTTALTDRDILRELEPIAERQLDDHLRKVKPWNPHDYVPWDDGRNFAALGGIDWEPGQSKLSDVARVAMVTNLLTEDNLPSYHRELSDTFTQDGVWGTWVGRWTAEENRHSIVMRDYLVVTRAVDPVALEQARMTHMSTGVAKPERGSQFLRSTAYVTFQELATRISHRNTGIACQEPIAERMLQRIAADENLH